MSRMNPQERKKATDKVAEMYNRDSPIYKKTTGDFIQGYSAVDMQAYIHYLKNLILPEKGKVLDSGCGLGGVSIALAKVSDNISFHGITISAVQKKIADENIRAAGLGKRILITTGDYHQLTNYFEPNFFDSAIFSDTLGHSPDPAKVLQEVYQVLRPGGKIYIRDIYIRPYKSDEEKNKGQTIIDMVNKNYAYHLITVDTLICKLQQEGFNLINVQPPPYPADYENMVKYEKALGLDTYLYIPTFRATDWFEIVGQKPG